jgi:hypothetical protein
MLEKSLQSLYQYIKQENYNGWDIFDGLNSRIFKRSPFYRSSFLRLAWIQFFKRCPVNFRKIALVPKGYNAKGLGLFASGLVALGKLDEAKRLLDMLEGMSCSGHTGISWGYNFDWQARAFFVPLGTPNIVTTVFVANAFLDYAEAKSPSGIQDKNTFHGVNKEQRAKSGGQRAEGRGQSVKSPGDDLNKRAMLGDCLKIAQGCCEFILKELVLFEDANNLCFGYIPGEQARIHNANMLGAELLARVYSINKNQNYLEKSKKAMAYSIAAMNEDYSWPYSEISHSRFIDNFHTGFSLIALKDWVDYSGENIWKEELIKAYRYFLDTFWLEDGCPKYYHDSLYPIDIHCSAQGIITCLKLREYDERSLSLAKKIAQWAIENMQDKKGYFYYQKTRWCTNKIPYMRWSQAWMFYALSKLSHECHELTRIIPDKDIKKLVKLVKLVAEYKVFMSRVLIMGCPIDFLNMDQSQSLDF